MVLYYGDTRWKKPLHLVDCLTIPDYLRERIPDYWVNLYEISYLTEDQIAMFQSDFRFVALYFVQNRREKEGLKPDYSVSLDQLQHVEEFLELMTAITGNQIFMDSLAFIQENRGKNLMMETIIDRYEARGKIEGRKEGIKEGIKEGELSRAKSVVAGMHKEGITIEVIARVVQEPEKVVREWLALPR